MEFNDEERKDIFEDLYELGDDSQSASAKKKVQFNNQKTNEKPKMSLDIGNLKLSDSKQSADGQDDTIGDSTTKKKKKKNKKKNKNKQSEENTAGQTRKFNPDLNLQMPEAVEKSGDGYMSHRQTNSQAQKVRPYDLDVTPLKLKLGESFYEDTDSSEDEGMPDYKIGGYHCMHVGEIMIERYIII